MKYNEVMVIEYEAIADVNFYCYFAKSGDPLPRKPHLTCAIKATPHFHRNVEFLFITGGEQKVTVDGVSHILTKGDILFVNSYQPHSYDECDADAYVLVLSSTFFTPFTWFFGDKAFPEVMDNKEQNKEIFDFIEKWYEEFKTKEDHYEVFIKANEMSKLITKKYSIEQPTVSRQNELVIAALKYISNHYCEEDLTLKSCSDAIGYSKEYVSKQFNTVMGVSFKSYVNNLRIKRFKELEHNEKGTRQELAVACGFNSVATFYRALKYSEEEELDT